MVDIDLFLILSVLVFVGLLLLEIQEVGRFAFFLLVVQVRDHQQGLVLIMLECYYLHLHLSSVSVEDASFLLLVLNFFEQEKDVGKIMAFYVLDRWSLDVFDPLNYLHFFA